MGISLTHLIIILVIVMIIWGPSRIGNLGRGIGEAVRGFKRGMDGQNEIDVTDASRRQNEHHIHDAQQDQFTHSESQKRKDKV